MQKSELIKTTAALAVAAAILAATFAPDSEAAPTRRRVGRAAKVGVKSLTLVDALSRKPINGFKPLAEGAVVNLSALSTKSLNLSVAVSKGVKSVRFFVDNSPYSTDSLAPFMIADFPKRPKKGTPPMIWPVTPGAHTVSVVPYSGKKGKGKAGAPKQINFSVVNELVIDTAAPPIPELEEWAANMVQWGEFHCNPQRISELGTWEGNVWYYDGMRVYYQIADYTKDPKWAECARLVGAVYRGYVLNAGGLVPGWRVFPHGLHMDLLRTNDQGSKHALELLATKSAYAFPAGNASFEYSRETAYILSAYLFAEQVGLPLDPDIKKSADFALGHLDQWAVSQTASYVQPYLVALTLESLIAYYERTRDPRIPGMVRTTADWLQANFWNPTNRWFSYIQCKPGSTYQECGQEYSTQGDLNLLIAPVYAWLYRTTGEAKYLAFGDEVFSSGIADHFLGYGKQFVQNYRWSFDYVKWRLSKRG